MHRRAVALVLGAALAAAAPASAAPTAGKRRVNRLIGRFKLRPSPGQVLRVQRGGVHGAGWLNMAHAASVAAPGAHAALLPRPLLDLRPDPGAWGRQREAQWCWAAASQMVLDYLGLRVSQEEVVTRAYGGHVDRPASPLELSITLDGWAPDGVLGVPRVVRASSFDAITSADVISDLGAGRPMILGLRDLDGQGGHAFVVTAITYDLDAAGLVVGRTVTLRDPWPDAPSVRELSWDELASRFLGALRVDLQAW